MHVLLNCIKEREGRGGGEYIRAQGEGEEKEREYVVQSKQATRRVGRQTSASEVIGQGGTRLSKEAS